MIRTWKASVVVMLGLLSSLCRGDDVPDYLQLARQLVEHVDPQHNQYQHRGWVKIEGEQGWLGKVSASEVQTDCSGLLDALLERTRPVAWASFRNKHWRNYPKAENYYDNISTGDGFATIATVQQVVPGDIFVAKYLNSRDTGHVMLVDAPPRRLAEPIAPLMAGRQQWEVTVIDSTSSPHWKGDTRYVGRGGKRTGIGRGTIRLFTNEQGNVMGWAWSMGPGSKFRDHDQLALGRPLPG